VSSRQPPKDTNFGEDRSSIELSDKFPEDWNALIFLKKESTAEQYEAGDRSTSESQAARSKECWTRS
jgi:hypothetical protein